MTRSSPLSYKEDMSPSWSLDGTVFRRCFFVSSDSPQPIRPGNRPWGAPSNAGNTRVLRVLVFLLLLTLPLHEVILKTTNDNTGLIVHLYILNISGPN